MNERAETSDPGQAVSPEAQARAFVESVDEMVYFQGLDGSLSMLNDANVRITGYSLEEFAANPHIWRDIVHPEDQQVAEAFFAQYPEGTSSLEVEYRLRAKDGAWRWIQSRMVGVKDATGRYIGYNCIDRDITKQKQLEHELTEHRDHLDRLVEERTRELAAASQAAEKANRAKTQFLANMSHEVRTPMNAILGLTSVLLGSEFDPSHRGHLQVIQDSARSLLAVLDDILDLARIEAGRLELQSIEFDLRARIRDFMNLFQTRAQERQVGLHFDIEAEVPSVLHGDLGRLRQILTNLLSNSLKFTSAGSVGLSISLAQASEDGVLIRFEVQDTGIGLREAARSKVFEPFTQEDASTTRRFGGAGLGLSIAKQLCELMGGEIGVESEPGKGSIFWFTVPFLRPSSTAAAEAFDEHREHTTTATWDTFEHRGLHILVAEDNPVNQEVAAAVLRKMGCTADLADNGLEALEALENISYDLILMDVQMPEMDGFAATREIRRRRVEAAGFPLRAIPIIAMTAHAMKGDREECLAAGMDDYLAKPFEPEHLAAIIERWAVSET